MELLGTSLLLKISVFIVVLLLVIITGLWFILIRFEQAYREIKRLDVECDYKSAEGIGSSYSTSEPPQ